MLQKLQYAMHERYIAIQIKNCDKNYDCRVIQFHSALQHFCLAVAVLVHFFFLAAFFVVLVEGVQLFIAMTWVFRERRYQETYVLLGLAWGKLEKDLCKSGLW